MAAVIESHIKEELQGFQSLVDAICGAGVIGPYVPSEHVEAYGYLVEYLGHRLWADFENLQQSMSKGVAPFSPGVSLVVNNEAG